MLRNNYDFYKILKKQLDKLKDTEEVNTLRSKSIVRRSRQ